MKNFFIFITAFFVTFSLVNQAHAANTKYRWASCSGSASTLFPYYDPTWWLSIENANGCTACGSTMSTDYYPKCTGPYVTQVLGYVSEEEYDQYLIGSADFINLLSEALETCSSGGGDVQGFLGDQWRFQEGLLKTTKCGEDEVFNYTLDFVKLLSKTSYKAYDSDTNANDNFVKAIAEQDDTTGDIFMPTTQDCTGSKCRVDDASNVLSYDPNNIPSGCIASTQLDKMICVNDVPEISRIDTTQPTDSKLVAENSTKKLITETTNQDIINNYVTNNYATVTDFAGGGSGGGSGGGGSGGGSDPVDPTDNTDGITKGDLEGIQSPYNADNTQSMNDTMSSFNERLASSNSALSKIANFSLSPKADNGRPMANKQIHFEYAGQSFDYTYDPFKHIEENNIALYIKALFDILWIFIFIRTAFYW